MIVVSYRQGSASGSTPCYPVDLENTVKEIFDQFRRHPGGTSTDYDHLSITVGNMDFVLKAGPKELPA